MFIAYFYIRHAFVVWYE